MQIDGTCQKLAYKQQVIELTTMLDNSLKELSQMKNRQTHMDGQAQKLKHQIQEKDLRIRVLQGEVSRQYCEYQKLQQGIMQKQASEMASTHKNLKLSTFCNSHLENQLQYYKCENHGLVSINQEYLHQLEGLRMIKHNQPQITAKYNQKIKQLQQSLLGISHTKPSPEVEREAIGDLSLSQAQDNLLQNSKQCNQCDTKCEYNTRDTVGKLQQQISQYRGMLEAQKRQHELSSETLDGQIAYLRDENINLREQLFITRGRNGLLEEKTIDLARELETANQESAGLSVSLKELSLANGDLEGQIGRLTSSQHLQGEHSRQTQEQLLSAVASVDVLQEKVHFLQRELRSSRKQFQNHQIQFEIEVEQLKAYEYEGQSMAIKYESLIQQKTKSYNTVKEQLIKLKIFLQATVVQDHSQRLVGLENENAALNDKIKCLQIQILGNNQQDNTFYLTDRTPLVMVSQTNLQDLDTRLKEDELNFRARELQQVTSEQEEKQINNLESVVERQKQDIMEMSVLDKNLGEFEKATNQQSVEWETMKLNIWEYQQEIRMLNQRLTEMDGRLRRSLKQIAESLDCQLVQQQLEGQCQQVVTQVFSKTKEWFYKGSRLEQCQLACDQYLSRIQLLSQENRSANSKVSSVDRLTAELLRKQAEILQMQHCLADSRIKRTEEFNSIMQQMGNYISRCHQLESAVVAKSELDSQLNLNSPNKAGQKSNAEEWLIDGDYNHILVQRDQLLIQISQLKRVLSTTKSEKDIQQQLIDSLNNQISHTIMECQSKLAHEVESVNKKHQALLLQSSSAQNAHIEHINHLQTCASELRDSLKFAQRKIERLSSETQKQAVTESTIPDKETEELRLKVSQLEQELDKATVASQNHLSSIRIPNDQPRPKDKKLIEKMRLQILALGQREQFLVDDRGKLRQDLFLARRQLDNTSDDLAFQRKRNNSLEELYQKFRVSQAGLRQRESLLAHSSD